MSDRQKIKFPAKDSALRDDVHTLGSLVGEILRDQGGDRLLEVVEGDRVASIRRREGDPQAAVEMVVRTSDRPADEARDLIRAFSAWFQVVNLAEKVHRVRRRRTYDARSDRPQPGGIGDCLFRLKAAGLSVDAVLELLAGLTIYPVFTAHPTESTRRTTLRNHQRIAELLLERLDPSMTLTERRALTERIRFELTTGWQTQEYPRESLTVADEREHALFYLAEVIYRIVPVLYEEVEVWLERVYGLERAARPLPGVLRFGSWVGGDMDGNPDVHAKTIRETLHRQQRVIISTYYEECLELANKLTQSASRVGVTGGLDQRIDEYSLIVAPAHAITPARHDRMPYRVFLAQVAARLRATYDGRPNGYDDAAGFLRDLELVEKSLRENRGLHAGLFLVKRLLRRARTFGFHLATLDIRQHVDVHDHVVGQGLGDASWATRPGAERVRILAEAIDRDRGPVGALDAVGRRSLAVFETILQGRAKYGERAVGDYIVSGVRGPEDLLSTLLLARWANITDKDTGQVPLDLVPEFEGHQALERAGDILRETCAEPMYLAHLESRGRRQTVLTGQSECNKECGIAAARFAVYQSQASLVGAAGHAGVELEILHGRGGTASRGGGPIEMLVQSSPPGSIRGTLRATEQGEVVNNNYGLHWIALRTFEQAMHAVMRAMAGRKDAPVDVAAHLEVMTHVTAASRDCYRALVFGTPRFEDYFRAVTPVDVIERMQIGSRPASRPGMTGIEALRPVCWVFAWTQSRHTLPGWYGIGSGLEQAAAALGPARLAQAWSAWPFFTHFINDVEMQLLRTDFSIASLYDDLAPAALAPLAERIRAEYELSSRWIVWLKGEVDLLDDEPRMQRSALLRSPYLDPMHYMQVDLLRRWRATDRRDPALFAALLASISGIAQGLQATG